MSRRDTNRRWNAPGTVTARDDPAAAFDCAKLARCVSARSAHLGGARWLLWCGFAIHHSPESDSLTTGIRPVSCTGQEWRKMARVLIVCRAGRICSQESPGRRSQVQRIAAFNDWHTVDQHDFDTLSPLIRFVIGCPIGDAISIEHDQIGKVARLDDASRFKPEAIGRVRTGLVNRVFESEQTPVSDKWPSSRPDEP